MSRDDKRNQLPALSYFPALPSSPTMFYLALRSSDALSRKSFGETEESYMIQTSVDHINRLVAQTWPEPRVAEKMYKLL